MKYVFSVLIFCVVLFFYLHITHHLYKSNDLEVFTIENPSKETLEEICNLRQPVLFDYENNHILNDCNINKLDSKYGPFDVKLRDVDNTDEKSSMYLPFVLKEANEIFTNETNKNYITENNYDFLEETGALKSYSYNDEFLRPPLVSKCSYDIMSGTSGSYTPLRYNLNYRNYYYVTSGKVNIKLIPPYNSKYLIEKTDYDNFEFRSPINPWNVQKKYENEYNKVKSLDIVVEKGTILYIPAYWWYSIQYSNNSSLAVFYYKTLMNQLSILPQTIMYFLQEQNIKRINFDNLNLDKKSEIKKKDINLLKGEKIINNIVQDKKIEINNENKDENNDEKVIPMKIEQNVPEELIKKMEHIKIKNKNTLKTLSTS